MPQAKANSFITAYEQKLADGSLRADAGQRKAAEAFELLYQQLTMYIWGDVGRGKSMLMDLFVANIQGLYPTRRVHFHAFMRDVHKRLFSYRKNNEDDVMEHVIEELALETRLLCLDELQVTDVTDAMILARLFTGLMDAGVTVVFTSNRPPEELYQGGLQREQFIKFIELLVAGMPIIAIESPFDYRLAQLRAMKRTYMFPRNSDSDDFLMESWDTLTHGAPIEPLRIEIDGRILRVDKHARGVAWMTFAELCMRPLGAGDYLELCSYFSTLLLQGVPRLTREERNEAKRFVTLIDALYDRRVKVIMTAESAPEGIYEAGDGNFEFARTVSRLIEMQSEAYLCSQKI
jgi:cell division protein ZapE